MKPSRSILDASFAYVPSTITAVDSTWRRFGWKPTTEEERRRRRTSSEINPGKAAVELKLLVAA